ncbi:oxidoreductase [Gracilinema caldarium]|uniref:Short-chain dehydrogenase/reductase SDR n=1 Tax=Gracilinema caldarium (strain ATCC 51460 / DSM 7334 / H1) TaxID=744872 RepID=F8F024_GRAC1|nr:oxidoreductase [Gracilinema caldarium]AEJ18677.1 short-chain dehydrogenase/reductase SDR [Gracilinema caldarium DSM 7334]
MSGISALLELDGKRIVVVGGAGLLGSKICEAISRAGARCVIADINVARAEEIAEKIGSDTGARPEVTTVSIVDPSSVDEMINSVARKIGGIDVLINSSYPRNSNYGRKFENVEFKDFCENVNLHLGGYFLVSQKVLEYFKANGGGVLLNMSSVYGMIAPRFRIYDGTAMTMPVEYAAIKSAIIHLTKYMAAYYAGNNIRVNCISLGGLWDHQPESFLSEYRKHCIDKGMLDAADVVGTVLFLASDMSRYVNGQNVCVDDGFTL